MRTLLLVFLLSGCTALDQVTTSHIGAVGEERVILGLTDSVDVRRSRDLDKYTCRELWLVCKAWGGMMTCSCGVVSP